VRICVLIFVLFASCDYSESAIIEYYGKEINQKVALKEYESLIPSDSIEFPETLSLPRSMHAIGDNLLFPDGRTDHVLHLYDPKDEVVIANFLKRGEGPLEATNLMGVNSVDNRVFIGVDGRTRDILNFSKITAENEEMELIDRFNNPFESKPSKVLMVGHNLIGLVRGPHSIVKYDTIQNLHEGLNESLSIELQDDLDPSIVNHAFFQGGILQPGSEDAVFNFMRYAPLYEKLPLNRTNSKRVTTMVGEGWDIEYQAHEKSIGLVANKTRLGFIDATCDDNYIYAIYSGDTLVAKPGYNRNGKFVFKIDRKTGDLVNTYKYDNGLSRIAIINDILYAYNLNNSEKIYVFNLSE